MGFAYRESNPVLSDVDLAVERGELVALLGPNGAGKSTLLRIAAGLLAPLHGVARWEGADLHAMPPLSRARAVSYLPQTVTAIYRHSAREVVALGRHPHLRGPFRPLTPADWRAVDEAMEWTATLQFAARAFDELSGGERQRVLIAAALAQGGSLLLLDEPTAALDLHHQVAGMRLLRAAAAAGRAVVCATHDLNLAATFATRLVLMDGGRVDCDGDATLVVDGARLARVYGDGIWAGDHPLGSGRAVLPVPEEPATDAGRANAGVAAIVPDRAAP